MQRRILNKGGKKDIKKDGNPTKWKISNCQLKALPENTQDKEQWGEQPLVWIERVLDQIERNQLTGSGLEYLFLRFEIV